MRTLLVVASVLLLAAPVVIAAPTLDIVEAPGDYYQITAVDGATSFWQMKVDVASGGIFSFLDLTDAGDGAGGHTDYCHTNEAYNRGATMLSFDGRGGDVFRRSSAVPGLADRLSFVAAGDGSSFQITYSETAEASGFFHTSYADGDKSLNPGDLLTTITLTITPPDANGTAWDWSIAGENVSDHIISPKVQAAEYSFVRLHDTVIKTVLADDTDLDGPWNPSDPVSYTGFEVGANPGTGFTEGRQFILDLQSNLEAQSAGGVISSGSWASFAYQRYGSPFSYSGGIDIGATQTTDGQFLVNIAVPEPATLSIMALGGLALLRRKR